VRVPGDDGPVAVVVDAGLGELQLERVRADLDRLDTGVLLDWNTILVPGASVRILNPLWKTQGNLFLKTRKEAFVLIFLK
jgi:hypothetical protein